MHKTKVKTVRAARGFGPGYYSWAECSCGYKGPSRDFKDYAKTDAKTHKAAFKNVRAS